MGKPGRMSEKYGTCGKIYGKIWGVKKYPEHLRRLSQKPWVFDMNYEVWEWFLVLPEV